MKLLLKLHALFQRRKLDADMAAEMRAHLEMQTQENISSGMSSDEARFAARRSFGGVEQIKEECRDHRGWAVVEQIAQDIRYAVRQLRRVPGFTVVTILSVALGIGATTAIFSVVNEVFLKALPVSRPDELVRFTWAGSIEKINGSFSDAYPDAQAGHVGTNFTLFTYRRLLESNQTLQTLFASVIIGGHTAEIEGAAENIGGAEYVSGQYFQGLGVGAWRGRTIVEADEGADAPLVAVISHAYWLRRFGGEPDVIGKTILVNLKPVTIIGVTPPEFRGTRIAGNARSLFLALAQLDRITPGAAGTATQPGFRWTFGIMGRLKPDVTLTQAQANFATVFQQSVLDGSRETGGDNLTLADVKDAYPRLGLQQGSNGSELLRREVAGQLNVLTALMGAMLLMACMNVANLLLARGITRRREIAMRLALGAGRGRLVRQLLVESLLLAGAGGALGLIFAHWGADLLAAMFGFGGVRQVQLDGRILGFATVVSLASGVLFGLLPALRATRIDLTAEFQGGSRTLGARSGLRLGKALIMAQVALSFVVLAGAGLFVSTLNNLRSADLGFVRDRLFLFQLAAAPAGYKGDKIAPLFERVVAAIQQLPGVATVTFSSRPVVGGAGDFYSTKIVGRATEENRPPSSAVNEVGDSFFGAYDLPAVLGRTLSARDDAPAPRVVVINQAAVEKFFPGENPVGRRIVFAQQEAEVVGVVRDIRYSNVREGIPPTVYSPFAQWPSGSASFVVRTQGPSAGLLNAIRKVVAEIDPHIPVTDLRTQEQQLERQFHDERTFAQLTSIFGGLALLLVCVGLYGLMSYAVQRRTGEIGVRMALGALPAQVLGLVLRESFVLVTAGTVLGIAGAGVATRLVAAMLFGVSPMSPPVYGAVAVILAVVTLLACWFPARRAAKVDPMVALRAE